MSEQTKGKIEFHIGQDYACLLGANDTTDSPMAMVKLEADARRLTVCWNACDGLETKFLERHVANKGGKPLDYVTVKAQRDELLAAAEEVLAGLDARLRQASESGLPMPVFNGIAALHDAIGHAGGKQS